MTAKAVLFTHCSHLVAMHGDIKNGETVEAEISHDYCPACVKVAMELAKQTELEMQGWEEEWDESSN